MIEGADRDQLLSGVDTSWLWKKRLHTGAVICHPGGAPRLKSYLKIVTNTGLYRMSKPSHCAVPRMSAR